MLKDYQKSMLSLFIELELKLAELYNVLAVTFPQESVFFKALNAEELKHAQWLEYFMDKIEQGEVLFHEDNARTYTLKSFIANVQTLVENAKAGKLTIISALSLSAGIEEALIERKVFNHFMASSSELKQTLLRLIDGTGAHAAGVKKLKNDYAKRAAP